MNKVRDNVLHGRMKQLEAMIDGLSVKQAIALTMYGVSYAKIDAISPFVDKALADPANIPEAISVIKAFDDFVLQTAVFSLNQVDNTVRASLAPLNAEKVVADAISKARQTA